jgi:DNA-binding transcriptional LysR family regulator
MNNLPLADLEAFAAVAEHRSFRKAAALRAVSASALSEAVRRLEARLDSRLLNRTTRSVTPTEAGQRLLERIVPMLGEISGALEQVKSSEGSPAGRLRLNVAVPIGPRQQSFVLVASPDYLARHGMPRHPRDLLKHSCIRHRFESGRLSSWEFEKDGEMVRINPAGRLIANTLDLEFRAAVGGLGFVATFRGPLQPYIDSGELVEVLADWQQPFSGPFLYYPSRRHMPAPLRAFVDWIRRHPAQG